MEKHEELRRVEVLRYDEWFHVVMKDIRKGETFRLFEPDGTPVSHKGGTEFLAEENAEDIVSAGKLVTSVKVEKTDGKAKTVSSSPR